MSLQELLSDQRQAMQTHKVRKNRTFKPSIRKSATKVTSWYIRSQRAVMYVVGFGFVDAAFWQWDTIAGSAATGVSLIILGTLAGGDDE